MADAADLATDPFLRHYVARLKATTPADDLRQITALSENQLISLPTGPGRRVSIKAAWTAKAIPNETNQA